MYAPVAQWLEHWIADPKVGGSSPLGCTLLLGGFALRLNGARVRQRGASAEEAEVANESENEFFGRVQEWFNCLVSKTMRGVSPARVRISPLPPICSRSSMDRMGDSGSADSGFDSRREHIRFAQCKRNNETRY